MPGAGHQGYRRSATSGSAGGHLQICVGAQRRFGGNAAIVIVVFIVVTFMMLVLLLAVVLLQYQW
ncbi:MAG: hypothetical protein ACRDIC_11960 [bacterium]